MICMTPRLVSYPAGIPPLSVRAPVSLSTAANSAHLRVLLLSGGQERLVTLEEIEVFMVAA